MRKFNVGTGGTALHHWPRENIERFSPSLQLMLRLESTLLRSLSGKAPDPFWVGNVDAETFANFWFVGRSKTKAKAGNTAQEIIERLNELAARS